MSCMSLHPEEEYNKKNDVDEEDDDESDEDYVPENKETKESELCMKKKVIKTRLKTYEVEEEVKDIVEPSKPEIKKANDLWNDFMSDVKKDEPKKSLQKEDLKLKNPERLEKVINTAKTEVISAKTSKIFDDDKPEKAAPIKKLTEASKEAKLEAPRSTKGSDRLSSILAKINKEPKISTLEKSLLDWNEYKKSENIEEDLETHNKGKNSYLEKKAFLERADYREFEIEKDIRSKKFKKSF